MSAARKPVLAFIFITLLLDVIGFGIIIPVLPKLITELTGEPLSAAARYGGWMGFAFAGMQFLFSPILGNLSDQYGRRPVLLVALFGFGLDYLFLAFAPTVAWLFVGRIIAGITGASFTTASAYIADISTPENRAQNFGMIGAAFGLGFIIGPVIGGLLGHFGPRVPFLVAAGLTLLNWLYGFFVLPESLDKEHRRPFDWRRANPVGSLRQLRKYPVILGLVGSLVLIYIAAHATQSTWSYFTMYRFHWNEAWVGYSLGVVGALTALVQGLLIRYTAPRLGPKRSVFVGIGLYALGFLLFAFASKGWMMFAFLVPYCLGGIAGPALQGIMSGQVPPTEQGELQGALTSLVSLTSIVGPPLMTNLFSYFTGPTAPVHFPGAAFLTAAVLTVGSLLLALRSLGHQELEVPAAPPGSAAPVGH
ncbi:TCR/Tet family MFS transporter [Microvirga sp. STR05]|uniref:TCR/Tet family MFS transporter n=1 Tax=Hymenobacter duratus TaxID=2771356 RepID=A0ABR8JK93_9BACT|nr:TCR/Tet family MFS transporter [Hymenobacter duratus]MBD2716126.1 TCR/Tet family MFS transporter [Hymenobacter duratus]MBR7951040.1 TCR/Tet family MFS transporter [Microvirga sp. STR05]